MEEQEGERGIEITEQNQIDVKKRESFILF